MGMGMNLTEFTPKIWTVIKGGYGWKDCRADMLAGLTVAIVALPLAMALAIASGASPDKGLITAVIAGFLISLLGGSRVQIGGPTGAFVVVVFNVIAQHGYDGLVLATLIAGIILVIAGYARLGAVIRFMPQPVIIGFTAGIAVIIASSQVKDFLGLRIDDVPADFIDKWIVYFQAINTLDWATLGLGAGALAMIIALRRYAPKWPGYLITIIVAVLIVTAFHIPVETIGSRFPDISSGIPMPVLPEWNFAKLQAVLPAAFTIAFLAGIEALLSAVVADGMSGFRHRPNAELAGQGYANIASALFGGLPATGAIARTATNIKAGGKTPVAGIAHAVFLLLFMLFAMDVVAFIPMAVLAAILFMVAWGMSEIHHFIYIFRLSAADRTVLLLTFFLTVLVDLTMAIGVGVTLACLLFMHQMTKAVEIKPQSRASGLNGNEEDEDETQREDLPKGVEVFRLTGPVFFGVSGLLVETLRSMGQMPKVLILRMRLVPYLDATGAGAIGDLVKACHTKGTRVILNAVQTQPRAILRNGGVENGRDGVTLTENYAEAMDLARAMVDESGK